MKSQLKQQVLTNDDGSFVDQPVGKAFAVTRLHSHGVSDLVPVHVNADDVRGKAIFGGGQSRAEKTDRRRPINK